MNSNKKETKLLYSNKDDTVTIDEELYQAAKIDPYNFNVWYALGVVYKLQDNLEEAEKNFQKALEIDPSNVYPRIETARIFTFKGNFIEAEKILLSILNQSFLTSIQKKTVLHYSADNYLSWANRCYKEKKINFWKDYIQNAIEFIDNALILDPQNTKFQELQTKVFLNYGLRLCQEGRMKDGEEFLLKIIKSTQEYPNPSSTDLKRAATACYYLAIYEMKKSEPVLIKVERYIKQGLTYASDHKIKEQLQELSRKVRGEKRRRTGRIVRINSNKKYGIIQSNKNSYIFFPSCLTWFCKDLQSLIDRDVSFIPISASSRKHPKGMKATQICLVNNG